MRKSYTVLKQAFNRVGIKKVAREMHLSQALLYKWCQIQPKDSPDPAASGSINPLDRIAKIYKITQDVELINWICQMADGYYVKNQGAEKGLSYHSKVIQNIQEFIKEFSGTLDAISESYNDDKRISLDEAKMIRHNWEDMKRIGEGFVRACEMGKFDK